MQYLSSELLDEIVNRLVQRLQPEQIILFGSYAYGEPTADSDIDLLVIIAQSNEPRYRRARQAHKSLRGIGVSKDVIVLTREEAEQQANVPNSIANQAFRLGKVLYG